MSKARSRLQHSRWTRDAEKESYWREQLVAWQKSGLSIRAFCKERGIVETSFYAWRRELIIRARESGEVDAGNTSVATTPNAVKDGRGRMIPVRFRQTDIPQLKSLTESAASDNPFVPLNVVPERQDSNEQAAASGLCNLKVVTPAGYTVVVSSESDIKFLSTLLTVLEERSKC